MRIGIVIFIICCLARVTITGQAEESKPKPGFVQIAGEICLDLEWQTWGAGRIGRRGFERKKILPDRITQVKNLMSLIAVEQIKHYKTYGRFDSSLFGLVKAHVVFPNMVVVQTEHDEYIEFQGYIIKQVDWSKKHFTVYASSKNDPGQNASFSLSGSDRLLEHLDSKIKLTFKDSKKPLDISRIIGKKLNADDKENELKMNILLQKITTAQLQYKRNSQDEDYACSVKELIRNGMLKTKELSELEQNGDNIDLFGFNIQQVNWQERQWVIKVIKKNKRGKILESKVVGDVNKYDAYSLGWHWLWSEYYEEHSNHLICLFCDLSVELGWRLLENHNPNPSFWQVIKAEILLENIADAQMRYKKHTFMPKA